MAPIIYKPDPGPERLKDILARVFTLRGWGRRSARLHLERAWAEAVATAGPDGREAGELRSPARTPIFSFGLENASYAPAGPTGEDDRPSVTPD